MKLPAITPDVWTVYPRRDELGMFEVSSTGDHNGGKVVALVYGPDAEANATALTAVPAMLEALQFAAVQFREYERHHRAEAEKQRSALKASADQPDSSDNAPSVAFRLEKADRNKFFAEQAEEVLRLAGATDE